MSQGTDLTATLADAVAAVDAGDWATAQELVTGLPDLRDSAVGQEVLARAAYGEGDFDATVMCMQRAHALHLEAGDPLAAAHAACWVAMYLMMDTGLMAPVRGWVARARRLLENLDPSPVHAFVPMVSMYERFMCGDMEAARTFADEAIALGTAHDVGPAIAMGQLCRARIRIFDGEVAEGLAELDEIAATLLTRELDALTVGIVWCELVCAVRGMAEYERAAEWTEAMQRWGQGAAIGAIRGRCRVHHAEVLRLHGEGEAAEDAALHACEELRPWMRREFGWPLTELGTIRLRRGDLAGAEEALLEAHEHGWAPQPALAVLRLVQGRTDEALSLIVGALDRPTAVPSKEQPPNVDLRRAPLLDAQVEIAVVAGDRDLAERAVLELRRIADKYASAALRAMALQSAARVSLALGDAAAAVAQSGEAVFAWMDVQAPWEAAQARLVLGRALRAAGDAHGADLEDSSAVAAFRRLGAGRWADLVAATVDDQGVAGATAPAPATSPPHGADAVFACEADVRTIAFAGRTVQCKDLKGMRLLARLLAAPGREFHAIDLAVLEAGGDPGEVDRGDAGAVLDDQARDAYRQRLAEVDEDIAEAEAMHDPERAELARADRDFLIRELTNAVGIGGRSRAAASTAERARFSVTRALRYAMARVAEHHPELAEHLQLAVRTGTYCAYEPDPRATPDWQL